MDSSSSSSERYRAITTKEYWNAGWDPAKVPDPIDPSDGRPSNHFFREMHREFIRALGPRCAPGTQLLEIGCGGSRWLPYLATSFGCQVSGIDYSPTGVALSRRILDKAGIRGRIVEADLFEPPADMLGTFDVVASFGVVEHFENTAQAVAACVRFARPGGTIITLVPTMRGPYGMVYRWFKPEIYAKHVPQTVKTLAQAHRAANVTITDVRYLLGFPAVLTRPPASASWPSRFSFALSQIYWRLEAARIGIPANRWTSPYAVCIGTAPASGRA